MNNKEKPRKELLKEIEELKKEIDRMSFLLKKNNTKHEQTNEALNENELSYRDMFEANPYPMWVFDIDTLNFLLVNDAAVDHYGYSREEFLSMTMKDIRPMEDLQYLHDSIAQATKKPGIDEIHARHLKKDGTIIDVEITSHQITYKGRVARLIRTHDITERKRNEEKLVQLQKAVDTSGEAIFITDLEGIFKYVNPAFTVLYGHTSEEIVGKLTPRIFKSGLMQPQDYEMFWKTLLSGQEVRGELINKRKDGTIINIEGSSTPILDEMNNIIGFLGIQRDITGRKQAEEALRISEEKYRTIFENVQDVFYQSDLAGIILEISPSIKLFSEFSKDEIIGTPVYNLYFNPDDRSILLKEIMKKGELRDYELKMKTKTGEIKYVSINANLISDNNGNPNHIDGALRDITGRKQAEQALKESEEKYRLLLDNATESIAVTQDNMLKYANPKASELFGYSNEELLSKPFPELIYPDDSEMVIDNYQRLLKNEIVSNNYQFRVLRKDKTFRWVEISAVLFEWLGNVASLNFLTDITIRKQAQQTLQDKVNELEIFNSLMVDREIKMIELKKEINELLKKEGKDEKYEIFE